MGVFDVRCGVTGLVLRTERVALLIGVIDKAGWRPIALPMYGSYDSYGRIENVQTTSSTRVAAEALRKLAKHADKPGPKLEGLLELLSMAFTDASPSKLDKKPIHFVFVERRVYDAIIEGQADAFAGKTFDELLTEHLPDGVPLYAAMKPIERRSQQAEASRFARFLASSVALRPTTSEDLAQNDDDEIEKAIAEARARFAGNARVLAAIDAYAASLEGEDEDGDAPRRENGQRSGDDQVAALLPICVAALEKLGFQRTGERELSRDRTKLHVKDYGRGESMCLMVSYEGSTDGRTVLEAKGTMRVPVELREDNLDEALATLAVRLPFYVDQVAMLGGEPVSRERREEVVRDERSFGIALLRAPKTEADFLPWIVDHLSKGTYDDELRLAFIACLKRSDCPRDIATKLALHTSKSIKDAAAARLARAD